MLQQIAQILSEERKKNDEERLHLEQQVRELEGKLEIEQQNIAEYQNTIEQMKSTVTENEPHPEQLKVTHPDNSVQSLTFCALCPPEVQSHNRGRRETEGGNDRGERHRRRFQADERHRRTRTESH